MGKGMTFIERPGVDGMSPRDEWRDGYAVWKAILRIASDG